MEILKNCILELANYLTTANNIIFIIVLIIAIFLGIKLLKMLFVKTSDNYINNNKKQLFDNNKMDAQHCKYLESELSKQLPIFNLHINNMKLNHVHDCSSSIVSNAEKDSVKYLIKYSNLDNDIIFMEQLDFCINYLMLMEDFHDSLNRLHLSVKSQLPAFINYFVTEYKIIPVICDIDIQTLNKIKHPIFCFLYVSPGGNSRRQYDIIITSKLLRQVQKEISTKLNKLGHSKNQRSAMSNDLREAIKKRDNYTCCICGNSVYNEPNLLLEVDHIIPISKGGKTEVSNLQTLCWRCNRAKSNK